MPGRIKGEEMRSLLLHHRTSPINKGASETHTMIKGESVKRKRQKARSRRKTLLTFQEPEPVETCGHQSRATNRIKRKEEDKVNLLYFEI